MPQTHTVPGFRLGPNLPISGKGSPSYEPRTKILTHAICPRRFGLGVTLDPLSEQIQQIYTVCKSRSLSFTDACVPRTFRAFVLTRRWATGKKKHVTATENNLRTFTHSSLSLSVFSGPCVYHGHPERLSELNAGQQKKEEKKRQEKPLPLRKILYTHIFTFSLSLSRRCVCAPRIS